MIKTSIVLTLVAPNILLYKEAVWIVLGTKQLQIHSENRINPYETDVKVNAKNNF